MTSIGDLLCRTDHLLGKYQKYDNPLASLSGAHRDSGDFEEEVRLLESEIRDLAKQAEDVAELKNRATVAAKNAEIRRAKNRILQTRLPEVQKKVRKGKSVTPAIITERTNTVAALGDATRAIPDGIRVVAHADVAPSRSSAFRHLEGPASIKEEAYRHTDSTRRFEEEWEASKQRQDEALNRIERGVGVLGNLARDMRQEVDLQNPVLDAMDEQLDRVKGEIKTRNQQMRAVLKRMGARTNICMDLTLIVILLALAAYIYALVV